ncbi:SWIB/MDM2 domain-containing protein [Hyaloraphidium curvatum]|nr:SWIB/MDM2 domain-containing protein [Hyaloraphidium curvatum]
MTDEELARLLQKEETGLRSRSGKRKAAPSAGASVAKRAKGGGDGAPKRGGGGFSQPYILSEELSAVCGGEKELPRGQVVKRLWAYIKGNSLQDPNNGRSILCDDALKAVFGKSKVDAFGMNKLLSNHLSKPGDLGGDHGQAPKRASSSRKPAKNGKAKPAAGGGKGGGGWNAPQLLSPELRSVIAETVDSEVQTMARPTVVKHLWIYIRAKGLQDPADKRDILTDDKLKAVFSQRRVVTMFQMNKLLKDHLKRVPVDMDAATAKWEDVGDLARLRTLLFGTEHGRIQVYGKTGDDRPRKTKSAGSDSDESSSAESSSEEE